MRLQCRGSKNCCFYCDDVGSENDIKVVKNLDSKQTNTFIIIYYSFSSLFDFNLVMDKLEKKKFLFIVILFLMKKEKRLLKMEN